jgi:MFS family permease
MRRIVWIFYGFQFFFSLLLWLPIFYEYQKQLGLSDTQIFSIQSIYYLLFCLFEIPTGLIADRFGHRNSLIAGAMILVVSNLSPIFFPDYNGFLVHFILIALSRSLISGASSAYIYDYLHVHSAAKIYKQIEGHARAYSLFGKVICWAAVGPLMQWHFTLPYWLTALSACVSVFMAFSLPALKEIPIPGDSSQPMRSLAMRLTGLWLQLRQTPFLVFLILQGAAIFVLARICQVNLFQPILDSKLFGLSSFGLIMSLMTVFEALGSLKPGVFRRLMTDFHTVYFMTLIMAGCLLFIPSAGKIWTLILLCVFAFATGLSFPVQRDLMNGAIRDSRYRATLLSLESIIDRGVTAWLASLIGVYLTEGHLDSFLLLAGFGAVIGTAVLMAFSGGMSLLKRRS